MCYSVLGTCPKSKMCKNDVNFSNKVFVLSVHTFDYVLTIISQCAKVDCTAKFDGNEGMITIIHFHAVCCLQNSPGRCTV